MKKERNKNISKEGGGESVFVRKKYLQSASKTRLSRGKVLSMMVF